MEPHALHTKQSNGLPTVQVLLMIFWECTKSLRISSPLCHYVPLMSWIRIRIFVAGKLLFGMNSFLTNCYRWKKLKRNAYAYEKGIYYSDGHKSCTFSHNFFCGPPGGGGPILELLDCVKRSSPSIRHASTQTRITRKLLKISLRKKSGTWRTPFYIIGQFQNWGGTKKFGKKCAKLLPVTELNHVNRCRICKKAKAMDLRR